MTKDEQIENFAEKLRLAAEVPDAMDGMSAHGDVIYDWKRLARVLIESGALEMPRWYVRNITAVDVISIEVDMAQYDRQAAAIAKLTEADGGE